VHRVASLKSDANDFSRLYIVAQHRECDMNTFFSYENHPFPPYLSDIIGIKSDLMTCLEDDSTDWKCYPEFTPAFTRVESKACGELVKYSCKTAAG
jgi:hypothetical protein